MRLLRISSAAIVSALVLTSASPHASASNDLLPDSACMRGLDAAAEQMLKGNNTSARQTLKSLISECPDVPQALHNLATLEARAGEWDEAIRLLEQSITLDSRAAGSVEALRSIHRWRAADAYAKALGNNARSAPPSLSVQKSSDSNSDTRRFQQIDAVQFEQATLDYELSEWWRSAAGVAYGDDEQHRAHYSADYDLPLSLRELAANGLPDWNTVSREIRFIGREAVALIGWTGDDETTSGRLLLMRVENDRWRIHEILPLP